ncbi:MULTISPECIES: DUF192 domain-containing protein [Pseudomonas]|jgi:uncharacterized membrane protein (UPF0127 family)|uniref:DUF192 domain-containing protein n=1 Tax=Pseudomonas flexibilis TaxID=706570 RepID=A0A0B3BU35_9PSED|nr:MULTISPECIES: DUF192 domain-containing protein [Pseudomonas]KHO64159.1 hypothetical protein PT85_12975 [Pseudomonas flexibilis]SCY16036.1 hypothetical protein SAMN02927929_01707 [Pseudomonas flexibilis]
MRALLLISLLSCAGMALTEPRLLALSVGGHALHAEYVFTAEDRQRGLMGRTELAESAGMLFRFPQLKTQCLWMKNTPLPLSAAFLDEAGRIINLVDLHPHDLTVKCSSAPARYALEVNQGWFNQRGIVPGLPFAGLPAD